MVRGGSRLGRHHKSRAHPTRETEQSSGVHRGLVDRLVVKVFSRLEGVVRVDVGLIRVEEVV